MTPEDAEALARWESVSFWGMKLVWLGVIMEGAAIGALLVALIKRRRLKVYF